jgi:hypothetical protein
MKIAITSEGSTLDDRMDQRFGRASKFIIFETDDESFAVVDNDQNLNAAQGAGIQQPSTSSIRAPRARHRAHGSKGVYGVECRRHRGVPSASWHCARGDRRLGRWLT